jgi:hypothetical protein
MAIETIVEYGEPDRELPGPAAQAQEQARVAGEAGLAPADDVYLAFDRADGHLVWATADAGSTPEAASDARYAVKVLNGCVVRFEV